MIGIISVTGLILSGLSGLLIVWNLFLFKRLDKRVEAVIQPVSVLIPARNEENAIEPLLISILANEGIEFEVLVMDDDSNDRTPEIVQRLANQDSRIKLLRAPKLKSGWIGKNHICYELSRYATYNLLVFVDADVRISSDALSRVAYRMQQKNLDLFSGFPEQITLSLGEKLIIPTIHFLLLGYLPVAMMRHFKHPAFGAGCGQFVAVRKTAYDHVGGHKAISNSMHDGIALPRAFRRLGHRTDIFDATDIAKCRMYHDWKQVWDGFKKNATEGMAGPVSLPVWTFLLGFGHILPFIAMTVLICLEPGSAWMPWITVSVLVSVLQRHLIAHNFGHPGLSVWLHPVSMFLVLGIQWTARYEKLVGTKRHWRGRQYDF